MMEPVLLSYRLDGNGSGVSLKESQGPILTQESPFIWVHLDANHPLTQEWLKSETECLDPFVMNELLATETRPRMTEVDDGALLILRGVNLNENADPEDMVSIRLWVTKNYVISTARRQLKAVKDIEEKIKKGKGPRESGEFVCMLTKTLFDRMEPVLSALDDITDDIEEKLIEKADQSLRESIVNVRKQSIMFRRYMAPQRDAVQELYSADFEWLNNTHRRHLQESCNHVTRYVENLDAIRERSQIVKDELANILSDKLNKNMYMLSVIAAIFLPLGFLTGLLGINVGGIPGAEHSSAFVIFCGMLVAVIVAQVAFFKIMKWF